ncbi:MAG: 16S rRNA (guanine(527)-N(7))-methyltransferase RsmG, partial [Pseudomonadales bacterium]
TRPAGLARGLVSLGLPCGDDLVRRLLAYLVELEKWNKVYNLTGIPVADWITRLLLDSLAIAPWVNGQAILDVGTGNGLPGLPLALLFPDKQVTLLDSNGKKTRFLEQVRIKQQLANVTVVQSRAEAFTGQFDIVTCRALASLADISALTAHLLRPAGKVLAMKGELDRAELAQDLSPLTIEKTVALEVPGLSTARQLVIMGHGKHHQGG